jgi:hypothetical protein
MSEPLEMPPPPRPKRLNRLALVAVLVLLGVAVAAVFSTLAPPRQAKVVAEAPDGNGPPRPGFLEREPAGAPAPRRRPGPGEAPGTWEEAMRAAGGERTAGAAVRDGTAGEEGLAGTAGVAGGAGRAGIARGDGTAGAARGPLDAAARAELEAAAVKAEVEAAARAELESASGPGNEPGRAGASRRGAAMGGERGATTPAPGSRQEAYRRALLAPVWPARARAEASPWTLSGREGAGGGGAAGAGAGGAAGAGAGEAGGEGGSGEPGAVGGLGGAGGAGRLGELGAAGSAEAFAESIARLLASAPPGALGAVAAPTLPAAVPGGFQLAGGPGGQPPDGSLPAAVGPAAVGPTAAGSGGALGREHQGFLRGAEALAPAELRVRRDRAGGGLVVEAGSVIPAALVTAVDSDVAGPLVAQVTQDVFDRDQRRVVIPRGSRLIGAYDNQVALGERRLLVAWSRVIFPDGSGASFPGLPAVTPSGEAGLPGSVDNHLARVFGSAVLLSVLSAGVQLSQPQESASFGTAASARQVAAAAVGQELSSVAIEMLRRQLAVPPTLRIAAGTRFYVFLRGDLRFEKPAPE